MCGECSVLLFIISLEKMDKLGIVGYKIIIILTNNGVDKATPTSKTLENESM